MRVRKHGASKTLIKPGLIENSRLKVFGIGRDVGLPSQAWDHRQMGTGLPRVLEIQSRITLAGIPTHKLLLPVLGRPPNHEIA